MEMDGCMSRWLGIRVMVLLKKSQPAFEERASRAAGGRGESHRLVCLSQPICIHLD
jgi:hypothetical protein